jgi:hypothetical protein
MESEITVATLVNQALIDLGQPANFSIDNRTKLGGIVDIVWPGIVDETFGLHDWTFCRKTFKLNRHEDAPESGWRYAFDLPGNKVGDPLAILIDARRNQVLREFYLEGTEVHCDVPEIWARCRVLVDPRYWDPAFRAAFRKALAAEFAVPLLQDVDLKDALRREAFGAPQEGGAGGKFGRLIAQNRAASPQGAPLYENDPLTSARWG